jgi:hypothetical protein
MELECKVGSWIQVSEGIVNWLGTCEFVNKASGFIRASEFSDS